MNTTIQVKETTVERLKYFKEYSKESYDEIINKLADVIEEGELTETAISKINQGLKDIEEGKVITLEAYAKKRGISIR